MSQMPPILRAYRQALRDVQRAVLLYGLASPEPISAWCAVRVAADWVSVPLREIRESGINALEPELRKQMPVSSADQTEYVRGYQAGFDKAVEIIAGWGRKMIDLAARDAIGDTVTRLQNVRSEMTANENGKISTLRARKFVI